MPVLGLAAALALGAGEAAAQGVFQCPTASPPVTVVPPTSPEVVREIFRTYGPTLIPTEPVECGYVDDSDRTVFVRNPSIVVADDFLPGIYAYHEANGDLAIYVRGTDATGAALHYSPLDYGRYAVRTMGDGDYYTGEDSHGVWAEHRGTFGGEGRVGIDFRDLSLSTSGDYSYGLYASQAGTYVVEDGVSRRARGAVIINLIESDRDRAGRDRDRPIIGTRGDDSDAVRAVYTGGAAYGHIAVTVEGYTIATGGIVPRGPVIEAEEGEEAIPPSTGEDSRGIHARHEGHGDIRVSATDSRILTWGPSAHGIYADHLGIPETIVNENGPSEVRSGGGAVDIDVTEGEIRTEGGGAIGIYGFHRGLGGVSIDARDVTVATTGEDSHGVMGWIRRGLPSDRAVSRQGDDPFAESGMGDVAITVTGGAISTTGGARSATEGPVSRPGYLTAWGRAFAVWGVHDNEGDVAVTVAGDAATSGEGAHAVFAEHRGSSGDVVLTVGGGAVTTTGDEAHGAYAKNAGGGTVTVAVTGGSVTTEGAESHGVLALQNGDGALAVRMTGGTVTAKGDDAHGIEAHGGGDVTVTVDGGTVAAQGARGAGVLARSVATGEGRGVVTVSVGAGGTVSTASGIGIYSDGPRDLNVRVAGRVEGDVFHNGAGALILDLPEGGVVTGTVHDPQNRFTVRGSVGRLFYSTDGVVTVARAGRLTGVEVELDGVTRTQALRSLAGDLAVTVQGGGAVTGNVVGDGAGRLAVTVQGSVDGDVLQTGSGALVLNLPEGGVVTGTVHDPAGPLTVAGSIGRLLYANGGTVTVARTGKLTGVTVDGRREALRSEAGDLALTVAGMGTVTGDVHGLGDGDLTATVAGTLTGNLVEEGGGDLSATVSGTVTGDVLGRGAGEHTVTVSNGGTVTGTVHLAAAMSRATVDGTVGRVRFDNGGTVTVGRTGRLTGIEGVAISNAAGDLSATVAGTVEGDIRPGRGVLTLNLMEGGTFTGTVHEPADPLTVVGSIGRLLYANGGTVTVARTGKLTGVTVDGRREALRSEAGDLTLTVAGMGMVTGDVRGLGDGDLTATVAGTLTGNLVEEGGGDLSATVSGTVTGDVLGRGAGEHTVTVSNGGTVTGTVHLAAATSRATVDGTAGRVRFDNGGTVTVGRTGKLTGVTVDGRREALRSEAGDLDLTVAGTVTGDVRGLGGGDLEATISGTLTGNLVEEGGGDLDATVTGTVTGDVLGRGTGEHTVTVSNGGIVTGTVHLAASTVTVDGTAGQVRFDNGGTVTVGRTGRLTGIEGVAISNAAGDLSATVSGTVEGDVRAEGDGDLDATVAGTLTGDLVEEGGGILEATISGTVTGDVLGRGAGANAVTVREGGTVTGSIDLAAPGSTAAIDGEAGRVRLDGGGTVTLGATGEVTGIGDEAITSEEGDLRVVIQEAAGETPSQATGRIRGVIRDADGVPDVRYVTAEGREFPLGEPGSGRTLPSGAYDIEVVEASEPGITVESRLAPRSRVYEALPSVVLGLNGLRGFRERMAAPRSENGGWARVEAFRGKWKEDASTSHASGGVEYRHRRYGLQVGVDGGVGEDARFGVSVHHRRASANVSRGGEIGLHGTGAGVSGAWTRNGMYLDLQAEVTSYDADLTSSRRGVLKKGVSGHGHALGVEAGRRMTLDFLPAGLVLTPRAGLVQSKISVDGFTDAVDSHVSVEGARSLRGRVGVGAEAKLEGGPDSRVFGSVDVEHEFENDRKVGVSGTELESETGATWLRLGLDGVRAWDEGRYTLQGGVGYATNGGSNEFGGGLSLRVRF